MNKVKPHNRTELKVLIKDAIKEHGFKVNLNFIDTSLIKDMSFFVFK